MITWQLFVDSGPRGDSRIRKRWPNCTRARNSRHAHTRNGRTVRLAEDCRATKLNQSGKGGLNTRT